MQSSSHRGRALPGEHTGRCHNLTESTTHPNHRRSHIQTQTKITPRALLPAQLRQAYIDTNNDLLRIRQSPTTNHNSETFGNSIQHKHHDSIRLVGQNIGCLGVRSFGNHKQDHVKEWLINNSVDICCWQELGISLHMLHHQDRIQERLRDHRWNKLRISASNNRHESIDKLQFGGTLTMAFNSTASRVHASGADERGLGRWTWLLFEGNNSYRTRVISAYVPCKTPTHRDATVYQQQVRVLTSLGITTCPRTLMITELTDNIQQWQSNGENIVLFIDSNENLNKKGPVQRALTTDKCKLVDPIRLRFKDTLAPPTYHRNHSFPIDSVFVSRKLRHITKGGWLRFGEGIGDHRAIFLDIPSHILLGEDKFHIPPPQVRRLKCEDPRIVQKFNDLLESQYKQHNVLQRIEQLNRTFHTPLLPHEIVELEKLDNISTFAVKYADKRCRKLHMGQVPFSDTIKKAGTAINLWKLVIRKKLRCNVSSKLIKNLARYLDIKKPMDVPFEECKRRRNEAYKTYNKFKKEAKTLRPKMQDKIADAYVADGNENKASVVRRIKLREETRYTHRRIKLSTKPFSGSVHRLSLADDNVEEGRRTTTNQIEIEDALMEEYESKYRLAYSSPLMQTPLREELGDRGEKIAVEEILIGQHIAHPELDDATTTFLEACKMPECIKNDGPNKTNITVSECNTFWNKMKEKIQSSKSNKHVGTYKAATKNPTNAAIQARLMSIPYESGYSLKRWQESLNVSLLKKQEKFTPEDLRTIWYIEADCNGGAKIHFARRMMHRAVDNNLLHDSQYAQPGKRAVEAALVKVLFFDHLRVSKTPGTLTMNDLMQCFDRMTHNACAIATRRFGVNPYVVQSMIYTIQKMRHFIRTAYGDSRRSYGDDNINPLQGGGQGNGAAGPFFIALASILLPILESKVEGIKLFSAISLTAITLIAVIYVDDSDFLIAARTPHETITSVLERTQKAANVWQESVHQTGGAIRPHKCRWTLVDFKWRQGKAYYKKNHEVYGRLQMKDTNGVQQTILRLQPNESEEGLGLQLPADGNQYNQLVNINKKTTKWIEGIKHSALTKKEVYISLMTSVSKTISYSLSATSFNEKELRQISTPVYKVALPRMGVLPTLPLQYRYAPSRYQGIDLPNFEVEQLIQKITIFLMHGNQNTQIGNSITLCLEEIQLELGLMHNFFTTPYNKFGHLTQRSWIRHLWESCSKHNITLRGKYAMPVLQREHDIGLMDTLISSRTFSKQQEAAINRCRIYLQAVTLSDIVDGAGLSVSKQAYDGYRDIFRVSKWTWPNQERPPLKDWRLWRDAINYCWTGTGTRRLIRPLNRWIKPSHQLFAWYYSPSTFTLFHVPPPDVHLAKPCDTPSTNKRAAEAYCTNYAYIEHTTSYSRNYNRTRSHCVYINPVIATGLPHDVEKATVSVATNDRIVYHGSMPHHNDDVIEFRTFEEYISHLPPETRKILEHSTFPNDGREVAQAIKEGYGLAVTDASYEEDTNAGGAAWIIVGRTNTVRCEGRLGSKSTSCKNDAYRSESLGLLGLLTAAEHLCIYHNISSGTLRVACDNDASLDKGVTSNKRMQVCNKHFDIFWATDEIRSRIPITICPEKVQGHQDEKKKGKQMTRTERLNCYVDAESKKYRRWLESDDTYIHSFMFGDNNWSAWIDKNKLYYDVRKTLTDHIQGTVIKKHIQQKHGLSAAIVNDIDWDTIERASKTLTIKRKLWLMKYASGFAPTASKMYQRKEWENDLCPICMCERETTSHLFSCQHHSSHEHRMKMILQFRKWLQAIQTAPEIVECFTLFLTAGKNATFTEMIPSNIESNERQILIQQAARSQDSMGWDSFCRGWLSTTWKKLQQKYLEEKDLTRRRTSRSWASYVVQYIYQIVYEQWEFRNSVVSASAKNKASMSERNKLANDVRKQFELGICTLRPVDHHLLDQGIQNILLKDIKSQKYWIRKCEVSRAYTKTTEENMLLGMRNIFRRWAMAPD